ncbi:MAG TPA: protein kinase, partial [Thermoanaerobaculia bacterium]
MPPTKTPLSWTRLCLAVAGAKIAVALVAVLWDLGRHGISPASRFPAGFHLTFLAVYGAWGAFLLVGGRGDPRARSLAGFYLTAAASFTKPLRHIAADLGPPWTVPLLVLEAMAVDAFIPFFLWRFAREFPEPASTSRARRTLAMCTRAAGWIGVVLFAGSALFASASYRAPRWLDPRVPDAVYDTLLILSTALAFVALAVKARLARGAERTRVRLFLGAFVAGFGPLVIQMVIHCIPGVTPWVESRPALDRAGLYIAFVPAWITPCVTAYSVLVHRVIQIRLIARQALQHRFARYSTLAIASTPFAALFVYLFLHRGERVVDLFSGSRPLLLGSALLLGIGAFRYRARLLDAIDRRYFREQYDARKILTEVVQRIRGTHGAQDLSELLCRGIDQALHLQSIALLVEDRRSGYFVAPHSRARRLDTSSALVQAVASASDPLDVDLTDPRSPLTRLPEADRHWLVDSGFRLLVPIVARDGALLGLIALGEKKSGLPFPREDRKLLYDIASSAALGLELELDHSSGSSRGRDDRRRPPPELAAPANSEHAKECLSCGTLFQPYTVFCGSCSRRLETALVPYVIPGRFRFERRLGVGGMGVVYRGGDLPLGRPVAAKTLRRVSPEGAMRLRREARTAAGVSHPHLAAVYGMETWQGTPMLILELMEGGTLAQRIERGPLDQRETVELGIAMASALEHLHGADILHRDIKPSNIGFTRGSFGHGGVPKLMDFGIARLMLDLRQDRDGGWSDEEPEPS